MDAVSAANAWSSLTNKVVYHLKCGDGNYLSYRMTIRRTIFTYRMTIYVYSPTIRTIGAIVGLYCQNLKIHHIV